MDKIITTTLLIAAAMIMALMLFNVAYPAVLKGGDAITSMTNRTDDRMKTQVTIIHAAGELDADGHWANINGNSDFEVFVWIKNVGAARIIGLDRLDVFFGPEGNFMRIPSQDNAQGAYPYWTAEIEGGGDWIPTGTLRLTIHYRSELAQGRYFTKVTVPSGVADDYVWGM